MTKLGLMMATLASLALVGCAGDSWENHEWFLHRKGISAVSPERFQVCDAYGCERVTEVSLTADEWQRVREQFAVPARSPRLSSGMPMSRIGRSSTARRCWPRR